MDLESTKAGSTRLFSAPAVKHTSCTEYQSSRGMNGKMRVCRVENLAHYAEREGSKSIFAFFPRMFSCCLSLKLFVEVVTVSVSGKITLLTPSLLSMMVCVPVIDADWSLGSVWEGVVLFWDLVGPGFLHTG